MAVSKSWWEAFQASPYPTYVTCIQPPVKGLTLSSKKPRKISVVAVDDVMDVVEDEDEWQPRTFELRKGSCVFVLPEDADSPDKASVSAPWMVRINQMWFTGGSKVLEPTSKADKPGRADKAVRSWELRQLKQERLCVEHFSFDMNYFYRLSDLDLANALASESDKGRTSEKGRKNTKTFCNALVTLGVVDTYQAAAELIKQSSGNTSARRMLSRFVCYSTHEGKLQSDDSDEEDEDEEEDQEAATDDAQPMESVMAPFKVFFLGASQRLPYKRAPVATAVETGGEAQHVRSLAPQHRATLLSQQQQLHEDLPPGFFCSLIFVKQTGQLFSLEEWAAGTAGSNIKGRWVQDSRKQVKELLAKTRQELRSIYQGVAGEDNGSNGHAAAAAGAVEDSEADSDGVAECQADGKAGPSTATGTPGQQEHSERQGDCQQLQPYPQPKRKTPRKRQRPRRAAQQSEQKVRRGSLRRAGQLAASNDGEGSASQSDADEEEEDEDAADAPRRKRQAVTRGRAQADSSGDSSSEDASDGSSEDASDSSSEDVAEVSAGAAEAADNCAAAAVTGKRARGAAAAKGRQQSARAAAQQRGSTASRLRCSKTPVLRTPKT